MYAAQEAISGWVWLYFFALITIGPWLVLNLFLVVISAHYDAEAQRHHDNEV